MILNPEHIPTGTPFSEVTEPENTDIEATHKRIKAKELIPFDEFEGYE